MSTTETSASGTKTGMDGNRKIMLGLVAALVVVVVGMVLLEDRCSKRCRNQNG